MSRSASADRPVTESSWEKRMRLRTSLRLVAIVLPVVLAAAACTPGKVHPPGALQHVVEGESVPAVSWGISTSLAAGATIAVTIAPFYNVRPYDISIVSVTAVDADPSLKIVGTDIAGPNRNVGTGGGSYKPFPPVDPDLGPLTPAAGFVLPADEPLTDQGYGMIVGIQGGGKPRALLSGIHIIYEANGVQYAYNEPVYVAVCAPPTTGTDCKPNDGAQ